MALVQQFERSSAYHQGVDLNGLQEDSFLHYSADDFDHNIGTLDGLNTSHGMRIIVSVTPQNTASKPIPITKFHLKKLWRQLRLKSNFSVVSQSLRYFLNYRRSSLWQFAWLVQPMKTLWNGYMKSTQWFASWEICCSFHFMPMIDMKASDYSCVYFTMHFVWEQAHKYLHGAVLTFDHLLESYGD